MIDWQRVRGFDWDAGNLAKSEIKHSVSLREAEELFFNRPLLVADDQGHSLKERRFHALGHTNAARLLLAVFTLRAEETLIRVISVRDMKARERLRYEKEA